MSPYRMLLASVLPLLSIALVGGAGAQQKTLKDQLIGTWEAVSVVATRPDGTKVNSFGTDVKGAQVFDDSGML
jgi:hypothetical protein